VDSHALTFSYRLAVNDSEPGMSKGDRAYVKEISTDLHHYGCGRNQGRASRMFQPHHWSGPNQFRRRGRHGVGSGPGKFRGCRCLAPDPHESLEEETCYGQQQSAGEYAEENSTAISRKDGIPIGLAF
jgi:hypothetical protein